MQQMQVCARFLKTSVNATLRRLGYAVTKETRPIAYGRRQILGSFPSPNDWDSVGGSESYCIHPGYKPREYTSYFDATEIADEWQREVYTVARELFDREKLATVCDVGCGSGFKLMKYFDDATTLGVELPRTCAILRKRWPSRHWLDAFSPPTTAVDLVIAADVIEHMKNPDTLLSYIEAIRPRWIVLSTPERNLLNQGTHNGPPHNPTHIREWSYNEFRAYISNRFRIEEHFITWPAQATQCVICRLPEPVST
jgi:hypothetical protein